MGKPEAQEAWRGFKPGRWQRDTSALQFESDSIMRSAWGDDG